MQCHVLHNDKFNTTYTNIHVLKASHVINAQLKHALSFMYMYWKEYQTIYSGSKETAIPLKARMH